MFQRRHNVCSHCVGRGIIYRSISRLGGTETPQRCRRCKGSGMR